MNDTETFTIGTLMEPDPIRFSFGAPGWFILLGVGLILLLVYGLIAYLRYKRNRYRRNAIGILSAMDLSGREVSASITRIAEVLKRVAMTSYGRTETAALSGQAWLNYLDQRNKGVFVLSVDSRKLIAEHLYRSPPDGISVNELEEFRSTTIQWINKHHV